MINMGKWINTLLLIAMVMAIAVMADGRHVTELTTENFDSLTSQGKWLIELYAVTVMKFRL